MVVLALRSIWLSVLYSESLWNGTKRQCRVTSLSASSSRRAVGVQRRVVVLAAEGRAVPYICMSLMYLLYATRCSISYFMVLFFLHSMLSENGMLSYDSMCIAASFLVGR